MKLCRHCHVKRANRPRGLCGPCYNSPARALFPSKSRFASHGVRDSYSTRPEPAELTEALPATAEKIAEMAERAARGETVFHKRDARRCLK